MADIGSERDMQYIVNGCVIVSNEGLRTVGEYDTEVKITTTPMNLLLTLIQNANKKISIDELFFHVWERYDKTASGSSLAVHLSNLRKHLSLFGIEKDVIRTLPGGYVIFSAEVIILKKERDFFCYSTRKSLYYTWDRITNYLGLSKNRSS